MEESAQILEIETFIPLLLQNPEDGFSRLKRWIMIGDHHQLPPVIKNMAFQKYSNMEQSLFTRIVRLGVPTVDLDGQGRARPRLVLSAMLPSAATCELIGCELLNCMNNIILWNRMLCTLVEIYWVFGAMHHFHLQELFCLALSSAFPRKCP
jgi:hypothetical protein